MQLFYNPTINETSESFSFDKEESKHIIKVLRKKDGDVLFVTNGLGCLFKTEIILASDVKCTAKIISFAYCNSVTKATQPVCLRHLAAV